MGLLCCFSFAMPPFSGATAAVAGLHSKEGQIVVAEVSTKSRLFNGVSIWVDGFTTPSHQVLNSGSSCMPLPHMYVHWRCL
jgi:hypothetical protein